MIFIDDSLRFFLDRMHICIGMQILHSFEQMHGWKLVDEMRIQTCLHIQRTSLILQLSEKLSNFSYQ